MSQLIYCGLTHDYLTKCSIVFINSYFYLGKKCHMSGNSGNVDTGEFLDYINVY